MSLSLPQPQPAEGETGVSAISFQLDRKQPVSEQVYDVLRRAIVSGLLLPGTSISENTLGRQFGVSRTPIRAAIQRLSEEGLIDVFPQQGSFVTAIRLSAMWDSHFVRRALEVAVIDEVAKVWSTEKSQAARAALKRQAAMIAAGDTDGFHSEDEHFHELFTVFINRDGVWDAILAAKSRLTRLHRLFGHAERLPLVVREHTAIIDALDAGDAAAARAALVYHLDMIIPRFEQIPERLLVYVVD
jgi:DNA-binding GntR family transcriptional regulator